MQAPAPFFGVPVQLYILYTVNSLMPFLPLLDVDAVQNFRAATT